MEDYFFSCLAQMSGHAVVEKSRKDGIDANVVRAVRGSEFLSETEKRSFGGSVSSLARRRVDSGVTGQENDMSEGFLSHGWQHGFRTMFCASIVGLPDIVPLGRCHTCDQGIAGNARTTDKKVGFAVTKKIKNGCEIADIQMYPSRRLDLISGIPKFAGDGCGQVAFTTCDNHLFADHKNTVLRC